MGMPIPGVSRAGLGPSRAPWHRQRSRSRSRWEGARRRAHLDGFGTSLPAVGCQEPPAGVN